MTPRNTQILDQIRAEALERDIPPDQIERWLELVRPCALLTGGGDRPVVGRFGGPVSLPSDVEDPRFPLIATIDCEALPRTATDLPLPADSRLLLFGFPDSDGNDSSMGDVVYVPASAGVTERAGGKTGSTVCLRAAAAARCPLTMSAAPCRRGSRPHGKDGYERRPAPHA